jgi:hypothetical protein
MAASAERGPEIGLGALRNRGGLCGYVHRRARSGHVRGSNSATLETQFVDTSAEFARRRRSADDPRGTGFPRNLPNSQPGDCVVKVPRWGGRALSHCFWQLAWNRSDLWSR